MRQESGFRVKVQSPVGAVGLAQLMPNTASRVIQEFGPVAHCAQAETPALDEPRCNMELGARYLRKLLSTFDGQLPLAVMAYNAGPQAVSRWVADKTPIPLDLFLARVPYAETRNYAQYVLTNFLVYRWLMQPADLRPLLQWTPTASLTAEVDLY
jgi:soluble lytic murein transglycosylase